MADHTELAERLFCRAFAIAICNAPVRVGESRDAATASLLRAAETAASEKPRSDD